MSASLTLTGSKSLDRLLRKLPERVQRKVMRQAINAAATPVVKAARRRAPKESGLLKKSLGKKVKTYTESQTVVAIVGPRSDVRGMHNGKPRKPEFYAHLVERGTEHSPADPFLRPAFDETKGEQLAALRSKLGAGVTREALKLKGKK